MGDGSAFSYLFAPAVALAAIGLLVLVLRWGFSGSPTRGSLVARRPRIGRPGDYGLLVSVAAPETYSEGETLRRRLEEQAVRASVVVTEDGLRVMVWPEDEQRARAVIAGLT